MVDSKQLPYLIQLLDDDSLDVQQLVTRQLVQFGPSLKKEIRKMTIDLNPAQREQIVCILSGHKRFLLQRAWTTWFDVKNNIDRLEAALTLISEFLNQYDREIELNKILNALARKYKARYAVADEEQLAYFLFKEEGLQGNEDDYYNPQNSNLVYVIKEKRGIPISLACIYILVGKRLGLHIEGCPFPGHFLARIKVDCHTKFVDCFSNGQIIEEEDIVRVREEGMDDIEKTLHEEVDAENIVRRFLANLIRAYQIQENEDDSQLMIDIFKQLDDRIKQRRLAELTPEDIINNKFIVRLVEGQIVRHIRYGYRGIIVDVDESCQATDDWYYSNQTQPDRQQPWYHILVDGSEQVTYVAESHLIEEDTDEEIQHPLVNYFFTLTEEGEYVRNDNPWPDTDF